MAIGAPVPVPAPPAQPPNIGLLPTFRALQGSEATEGWEHGFAFAPEQCLTSSRGSWDCDTPGDADSPPANPAVVQTRPFFVRAFDKCAPWDRTRDWQRRADNMLAASESFQIADELWTGSVAQASVEPDGVTPWPNRYLASADADVLNNPIGDPAFAVVDALACLEYALGQCQNGGRGVIHCTRQLATHWSQRGMLRREGAMLLTTLDTIVVADAGYDGSGPAGQGEAEGSQWAYATGIPIVRLGPVRHRPGNEDEQAALAAEFNSIEAQRFDPKVNLITVRSERTAAVTWDSCCHLAVNVDLPLCYVGGAS